MANYAIQHLTSKDAWYWLKYYIVDYTPLRRWLSDKAYLKIQYRCLCGETLDLINPKSFNEKLQWLKVYDHNPDYSKMVDKRQKNMLLLLSAKSISFQRLESGILLMTLIGNLFLINLYLSAHMIVVVLWFVEIRAN